jgi:histidinol-phosphate aminotransferase
MFNLEKNIRQNILNLHPYSSARDEFAAEEGIFLDANENPFGSLNRYPDPYQKKLKALLAEYKQVDAAKIFIGNGSDEIIDIIYRIFCRPSIDKVLTFYPTYGMYEVLANINDIECIKLPLDENFQINLSALSSYFHDEFLKVIFICSPNNPTGNVLNGIEFIVKNFSGLVVVDEAYSDFCAEPSWVQRLSEYPQLVVLQTFSKAWGLAAARVGMAFASKEIVRFMNKVKPPYNVSALNQQAAEEALKRKDLFEDNRKKIVEQKLRLEKDLLQFQFIKKVYPSQANFLLVEVDDADSLYQYLVTKKIITRNRSRLIKNCIRITVGHKTENDQLIQALNQFQ